MSLIAFTDLEEEEEENLEELAVVNEEREFLTWAFSSHSAFNVRTLIIAIAAEAIYTVISAWSVSSKL